MGILAAGIGVLDAAAQTSRGKVSGKVLAKDSGEPLPYADVLLMPVDPTGKRSGAMSNADGTFTIEAEPGAYTLQIRSISYRTKQVTGVTVVAGQVDRFDVQLDPDAIAQEEVVVEARALTNTEGAMLNARRKATSVGDAVSAEQVRKSADRDVADVLKRVTGTSVVDNKYVYVRGLGERYSSTSIDGVRVTSPEPGKRVVPLDLVPANLLENVVVQKTYTADRPGEFGGGDVQVRTKAFPGRRTLGFTVSQGWSEGTTFKKGFQTYDGTSGDTFGYGTGSRGLPSLVEQWAAERKAQPSFDPTQGFRRDSVEVMGSSFANVWSPHGVTPGPNGAAQLSFGDELKVFGDALGVVGSLSWSKSNSYGEEIQRFYENNAEQEVSADYAVKKYTESVLFGGTGGVAYRLGPSHALDVRGTYSNSAEDEVRQYSGFFSSQNADYLSTRLRYVQRQIRSGSLGGVHDFPSVARAKLTWRGSLSSSERSEPDRREYYYVARRDDEGNPAPDLTFTGGGREFGELEENGTGFDAKVSLPVSVSWLTDAKVDFGVQYQDRERVSTYRRFGFSTLSSYGTATPPESIYAAGQWGNPVAGAQLNEYTFPEDSYEANQVVRAAFASGDLGITRRLRAIVGLRYEDGVQGVRTYDYFTNQTVVDGATGAPAEAHLENVDFLPSLNLIYQVSDRSNLRLAAARTLSRPDIRELNPGTTQDFLGGFRFRGNPALVRATILNYDVRAEHFPSANEVVAASLFYKDFTDPIEHAILPSDQPLISPINSEQGRNVGVELEGRFNLMRVSPALAGFTFNLNASVIDSKIELAQGVGSREHPLQGQSDYLVNLGLGYGAPNGRWDGTMLINRVGRRLANLGFPPNGDIYDEPTTTVDLALNYRPWEQWRFKLAGANLFDANYVSLQNGKIWRFAKPGRTVSLSLAFGS